MQRWCFPLERNGATLKPWASPPSCALDTAVVVIDRMTAGKGFSSLWVGRRPMDTQARPRHEDHGVLFPLSFLCVLCVSVVNGFLHLPYLTCYSRRARVGSYSSRAEC